MPHSLRKVIKKNMNKTNLALVLAVLAVVIGGVAYTKHVSTTVVNNPVVSSVASPDILSPYFSFGGVKNWGGRTDALTQATTTICAIQSPASTSTLQFASIRLSVSSSTASRLVMAKAANAFATTTSLGSAVFPANTPGTLIATTTPADALDEDKTFGPLQWLVVGMQDNTPEAGAGTFSPTGTCVATWIEN